ncbi:hypothetical protein ACIP3U_12665 [[Kitasatospora] papulosa]|uniref:hypothetical protein n=1 Tax=[Kitasatospora] papulosa TaxID=1464011 RepID=UPI003808194F
MADSPGTTDVHAMVVQAHGGPDFLTAQDVRLKAPGPGEVLVRLAVAGINFVDIYMRRGLKRDAVIDYLRRTGHADLLTPA